MNANALTLNIGLAVGNAGHLNSVAHTVQALERTGLVLDALRILTSDTEPTVVAEVHVPTEHWGPRSTHEVIHGLAVTLGQQAIAAYGPLVGWGANIGPQAREWGAFDASLFFTLAGRRLSEVLPLAA